MKPSRLLTALAALALSAVSAGAMDVVTARGTVAVDGTPKTIAVYDAAAVDTLNRLGIHPAGLPDKLYVPALEAARDGAAVIGTLFEPDLEALSALAPDLVVVGARSAARREAVARVAPAIDMTLAGADMIAEARARTLAYGELFGRQGQAAELVAELDAAVRAAREAVAGKGDALIVMTSGPKISVYGAQSRFGWLHRELGLAAAAETAVAAQHGEAVSFEFVREADPDWLIVLDRAAAIGSGEANARATLDNELVAATTAWRKGQVIYLPAADFYIGAGGVPATVRVLDALAQGFAAR